LLYAENKSTVTWRVTSPLMKDGKLYFGTLYWRTMARDNHSADSDWNSPRSFEIYNVPPDAPKDLSVSPTNPSPDSDLTFSWLFMDRNMGDSQTYYQIQLNTTDGDWGNPQWDSTKTAKSGSWDSIVEVSYSGSELGLRYDTDYYWRVWVWDQEDSSSTWSGVSSFKTTIFEKPEPQATDNTFSIAIGDLNNDGYLDYVAGNQKYWDGVRWVEGYDRVYLNNQQGGWEEVTFNYDDTTKSVALADVNNDGYLDIIVGNSGTAGETNRIYINNPANPGRNFTVYTSAEAEKTYSIAVGDLDNDGDIDYVAGNIGVDRIYINEGGVFRSTSTLGGSYQTYSVAIGDIDNDGDLDIVAGFHNQGSNNIKIYRNAGGFNFTEGNISCDVDVNGVSLGDLNGDGYLDIVAGTSGGVNSRVYLNKGAGSFASYVELDSSTYVTTSIALGDIDNDGDLDIVLGNNGEPNLVYTNDGTGAFTLYEQTTEKDPTNSVALGDLDNDGDLDFIVGNNESQPNRIYISRMSEIRSNGAPSPPLVLNSSFGEGTLTLSWSDGTDDKSSSNQLYYAIRAGKVSGSSNVVSGCYGTPLLGNYIRPKLQDGSLGIKLRWTQGTTCFWQVRTIDSGLRASSWSDEAVYSAYIFPPQAPTDFKGVAISSTTISWSWTDNSSGDRQESGFRLYDPDTEPDRVIATTGSDTTSYFELGLAPNRYYRRYVQAYNVAGSSSSTVAAVWTLANPPAPTGQFDVYSTSITVHWGANGNPDGTKYNCRNIATGEESGWITATSWTSTGLRANVRYDFEAQAINHGERVTDWVDLGYAQIGNNPPLVELLFPRDGASSTVAVPTFVARYADPDGDSGKVQFKIFNIYQTIESGWLNPESGGVVFYQPILSNGDWYWQAWAKDEFGSYSFWTSTRILHIDTTGPNNPPEVPLLTYPDDGATIPDGTPLLKAIYYDPDGDRGWLYFQISNDPSFGIIIDSGPALATSGFQEVGWEVSPDNVLSEGTYYWRAKANDDKGGSSDWSGKRSLTVEYSPTNRAPSVNLRSPIDGSTTYNHIPKFEAFFSDPDNDLGRVHFQVSTTNLFNPGDIVFQGWSDYVRNGEIANIISDLLVNGTYYWRAKAQDEYGKESSYTGYWTLTIIASPDNTNPAVTLISPEVDAILRTLLPEFKARYNDSDGDMGLVIFEISATPSFDQVIRGEVENLNSGDEAIWQVEAPSPLSNGTWYWRAKAIDYRGGDSGWSGTRRFSIDTTGNQPPRVPVLVSPEDGATEDTLYPTFRAYYEDPDSDTGWIYFEVSFQGNILASGWSSKMASGTEASWIHPLPDQSTLYWRAESFDGRLYSSWSSTRSLHIATPVNNPPNPPELVSPPDGDVTGDFSPLFTAKFTDPDMNGLKLGFELSSTNDFGNIVDSGYSSELIQDAYGVYWGNWEAENIPQLGEPRTYYWRATAYDSMGGTTRGSQVWRIVIDPNAPRNHLPVVYFVSDPRQLKPEEASGKIGIIDTKVEVADIDGDECVLSVEYSTAPGAPSQDDTIWNKATIMDAQAEFGDVAVDNGGQYQITGIRYTSFSNQINFKWDSKSDLPSGVYDPVYIRVVVSDGLNSGSEVATTSIDLYCQSPDWLISTGRTDTTISLRWGQSEPDKVSGYEIRYSTRENLENYKKLTISNRYQTEATVTGLTPNTTYYFNIASFDEFGNIGLEEENKLVEPTEVAQPGPPVVMGLYDEDIGGTGYYTRIEFDTATINNNPTDTIYAIRYIIDYANDKWLQGNGTVAEEPIVTHIVTGWQTGIVNCHTGLEAYTYYKYIIRAYGKKGEYKESSSYGYAWTPPGKPYNVKVAEMPVYAPDYLRVSWDNLTGADTYKLYISTATGGEPVEVVVGIGGLSSDYDVDGGTPTVVTSLEITGIDAKEISLSWTKPIGELAPSATYYFKVSGVTTQGSEGPKSDEASGQLHPVIDYYNLYRHNLITGTTNVIKAGRDEYSLFVDSTVTPNTRYSYRVSAISSDELEGPLSSSTTPRWTRAAVPEALPFSNVSSTSIQSNWDANGNPPWTKYRVECSTSALFGAIVDSKDWTVGMLSWSASNLSINSEYYFRAQAKNEEGVLTAWRVLGSTYTLAVTPGAPKLAITITPERLLAVNVVIDPNGNPYWTEYSIEVTYDYGEGPIKKYVQSPDTTTWLATLGDKEKIEPYSVWGGTAGIKNIWRDGVSLIGNTTYSYRVRAWNGNRIPTDFSDPSSLETPPWLPVIWAKASDGRIVEEGDFLNVDMVTFTIRGSDYYYYKWNTSDSDTVTPNDTQLEGPVAVTTLTMVAETSWYLHVLGWNEDINTPTSQTTFGPITYDIQNPTVTLVVNSGRILRDGEIVGVLPETSMEAKFSKVMKRSSVEDGLELIAVKNNLNEPINDKVSLNFEWDGSTKTVRLTLQSGELKKNYVYKLQVTDRATDLAGNTVKGERELIFRTIMDYTKKNIITKMTDERIIVTMEANTLNRDGYLVINTVPLTYQYRVNPDNIVEANKKVTEGYQYPIEGCLWEFNVYDRDGNWIGDGFKSEAEIALPYTDDDGDGMVGNPSIPVKEETLLAFWLNEEHSTWVRVPGSKGDREKDVVTVKVPSFSVYALMGSAVYDLSNAHAYPVPWKPNDGKDETGTEAGGITFTNLSTEGVIKIYTISGELVMKYEYKPVDKGKWNWDVKTSNKEKVFSGVYIYYIENEKEHKTGKLIIIR